MILVRKTDRTAINVYLDEDGVFSLRNGLEMDVFEFHLDSRSLGFKSKVLNKLKFVLSENDSVKQANGELTLEIDRDDLDYLKFKLDQYFEDLDFIPEELFTLKNKGNSIYFFLTKIEYLITTKRDS
ncbi:MAG: hypothetical protein AB8B56_01235 [Crocinitomicaceae bacterium]